MTVQPDSGVGLMVAGPLTVIVGLPFSFLGNTAWRNGCGPDTSTRDCTDGSFAAGGAHTVTGLAYAAGIAMTAAGTARRGRFDAAQDPTREGAGFVIGGALLLPGSLVGMGMARLFYWLPTPDCQTYACVQQHQSLSTITVGSLAMTASIGAGLLMYGTSYNRHRPRARLPVAVLPNMGRGYTGLSLTGKF